MSRSKPLRSVVDDLVPSSKSREDEVSWTRVLLPQYWHSAMVVLQFWWVGARAELSLLGAGIVCHITSDASGRPLQNKGRKDVPKTGEPRRAESAPGHTMNHGDVAVFWESRWTRPDTHTMRLPYVLPRKE